MMSAIHRLVQALDERTIADQIGKRHDEARMFHFLRSNTVDSFSEFSDVIGDYYNYHFTRCVSNGGALSKADATSRAKEIIEEEYRRQDGNIVNAYNDAHDGTHGGLRAILDLICEGLKAESVENYTRQQFDLYVSPADWNEQVQIIREFIERHRDFLGSSIQADNPQKYARDYKELITAFVREIRRTSRAFRRI
ncbi:MAG: hypothetical protein ABIH23_26925 [bacterium]